MKNLKSKIKNMKGITLISLVITIIILLILAGITISQLSGSGIFAKAKEARDKWQNAQNEEEMQIAKYSNEIDSIVNGNRNTITLTEEELNNKINTAIQNALLNSKIHIFNETWAVTDGELTVTHNLGTTNYTAFAISRGSLTYAECTKNENTCIFKIIWSNSGANYTGNYEFPIFIIEN